MSAPLTVSAALLNSRLVRTSASNLELMAGYASGEVATLPARSIANRAMSRFHERLARSRPQRSPDRQRSIERRRLLAATYPMPPVMARLLTTSQLAYARIVADEVKRKGYCDLTLEEIAARGGMCRKTAQRAQDRLAELGWITIEYRKRARGYKHLPNVVRVVSAEWTAWIKMGPKSQYKTGHSCLTTERQSINSVPKASADRLQRAYERKGGKEWRPPDR